VERTKIKIKLLKAMQKGLITPYEATKVLTFKTKKELTKLMDTINELYQEEEIIPITIEQERYLMLKK
jgi:hypothetical protein